MSRNNNVHNNSPGLLKRTWRRLLALPPLILLILGGSAGIVFWGGFNTSMEAANTMSFCISCHEMNDNAYKEFQESVHYKNASGVQASCPDCHVPKPWGHKMVKKIKASNEIIHKILGTINTPEKYEAHRWEMASRVWAEMKKTDSRECRNCHAFTSMDLSEQDRSARKRHGRAVEAGETCIDCHKGIAHEEPDEPDDATT